MLDAYSVYLFIAEPPSNATGPRKFVFDEFRCVQGPHVDTMFAWVPRGKSQMLKFHEKIDFSWELGLQNKQNRFADANRPPSVTPK